MDPHRTRYIHRSRGASTRPNALAPGKRSSFELRDAKSGQRRSHQARGFTIARMCPHVQQTIDAILPRPLTIPGKRSHFSSELRRHSWSEIPPIGLWRYTTQEAPSCAPGQIEAPLLDQKRPHQVVTQPRPLWGMSQIRGPSLRGWDFLCHELSTIPKWLALARRRAT